MPIPAMTTEGILRSSSSLPPFLQLLLRSGFNTFSWLSFGLDPDRMPSEEEFAPFAFSSALPDALLFEVVEFSGCDVADSSVKISFCIFLGLVPSPVAVDAVDIVVDVFAVAGDAAAAVVSGVTPDLAFISFILSLIFRGSSRSNCFNMRSSSQRYIYRCQNSCSFTSSVDTNKS